MTGDLTPWQREALALAERVARRLASRFTAYVDPDDCAAVAKAAVLALPEGTPRSHVVVRARQRAYRCAMNQRLLTHGGWRPDSGSRDEVDAVQRANRKKLAARSHRHPEGDRVNRWQLRHQGVRWSASSGLELLDVWTPDETDGSTAWVWALAVRERMTTLAKEIGLEAELAELLADVDVGDDGCSPTEHPTEYRRRLHRRARLRRYLAADEILRDLGVSP